MNDASLKPAFDKDSTAAATTFITTSISSNRGRQINKIGFHTLVSGLVSPAAVEIPGDIQDQQGNRRKHACLQGEGHGFLSPLTAEQVMSSLKTLHYLTPKTVRKR